MLLPKFHMHNLLNLCSRLVNSCSWLLNLCAWFFFALEWFHLCILICSLLFVSYSNSRGGSVKFLSLLYRQLGRSPQNVSSRLAFWCDHIVIIAISKLSAIVASFRCYQSCAYMKSSIQTDMSPTTWNTCFFVVFYEFCHQQFCLIV